RLTRVPCGCSCERLEVLGGYLAVSHVLDDATHLLLGIRLHTEVHQESRAERRVELLWLGGGSDDRQQVPIHDRTQRFDPLLSMRFIQQEDAEHGQVLDLDGSQALEERVVSLRCDPTCELSLAQPRVTGQQDVRKAIVLQEGSDALDQCLLAQEGDRLLAGALVEQARCDGGIPYGHWSSLGVSVSCGRN